MTGNHFNLVVNRYLPQLFACAKDFTNPFKRHFVPH